MTQKSIKLIKMSFSIVNKDDPHILKPIIAGLIYFVFSITLNSFLFGSKHITATPNVFTYILFICVIFVLILKQLKNEELSKRDYFKISERCIRYIFLTYIVLYTFETLFIQSLSSMSFALLLIFSVMYFYVGGLIFSFVLYWIYHNILSQKIEK